MPRHGREKRQGTITCRTCGTTIRGNAAEEEYDERLGRNLYRCKKCYRFFQRELRGYAQHDRLSNKVRPEPVEVVVIDPTHQFEAGLF